MTYEQITRAYRSIGLHFFVDTIERMLERKNQLNNSKFVEEMTREFFNTEGRDSNVSGTKIRVGFMKKIIDADKYIEVLRVAKNSSRLELETRKKAALILEKLEK